MASPLRVLICDDILGFRALVQAWLSRDERFEVVGQASGGEQAKRMVAQLRPDLLVLDFVLPDAPSSAVLVGALRDLHPALRILLVSSLHAVELEPAGAVAGADGICHKGASPDELIGALLAVAGRPA